MMEEKDENPIDSQIEVLNYDMERVNEQKLINLLIEIIVTITLKELNEKSD
ncbi:hypothetical protein [Flavobacterium geliluteum]|uniref:Uncharacterized protein n=1 Tax=Flavobacterium geliluteum TaxID=2816120 RepID=A0A941AYZ5_9FLAO|nr:hypothetical protein [Flavobacterium geliluteum]MBP4138357.1 hypothetical protein [Flavobacterium geliluteum]